MLIARYPPPPLPFKAVETWLECRGGGEDMNGEAGRVSASLSSGSDIQAVEIREVPGDPTHMGNPPARW